MLKSYDYKWNGRRLKFSELNLCYEHRSVVVKNKFEDFVDFLDFDDFDDFVQTVSMPAASHSDFIHATNSLKRLLQL